MATRILQALIVIVGFGGAATLARHDARAAKGLAVNVHTIHREVIPSFTRQTGLACNVCHTTFPQLTPFGRRFKLNGYTLTGLQVVEAGDTAKRSLRIDLVPPVSAMVLASGTRIRRRSRGRRTTTWSFPIS